MRRASSSWYEREIVVQCRRRCRLCRRHLRCRHFQCCEKKRSALVYPPECDEFDRLCSFSSAVVMEQKFSMLWQKWKGSRWASSIGARPDSRPREKKKTLLRALTTQQFATNDEVVDADIDVGPPSPSSFSTSSAAVQQLFSPSRLSLLLLLPLN